jgi:hypothetical protein
VLRFVVELGDGRRYPVEMRGDEIRGLVADGHRVAVDLSALERGTVRTTHVRNLTTAADVETWSPPPWRRATRAATRGQVVSGILTAGIVTGAGSIYRLARPGKKHHKTAVKLAANASAASRHTKPTSNGIVPAIKTQKNKSTGGVAGASLPAAKKESALPFTTPAPKKAAHLPDSLAPPVYTPPAPITTTAAPATRAENGSHDTALALVGGVVFLLAVLLVLVVVRRAGDRRRRLFGAAAGLAVGLAVIAITIRP